MPARSEQQQKLFGLALSVKRGDTPRSEASDEVLKIVDTMSEKEIEDFAGTSHEKLPQKVEEFVKTEIRNYIRPIIGEGRAFVAAAKKAKEEGKTEFEFNGKTYPITLKEEVITEISNNEFIGDQLIAAGEGLLSRNDFIKIVSSKTNLDKNIIGKVHDIYLKLNGRQRVKLDTPRNMDKFLEKLGITESLEEFQRDRQLRDPKKEMLIVKNRKVIVINKKDFDKYKRKGWMVAESVMPFEDAHELVKKLKKQIDAPEVGASIATLGGKERPSVILSVSLNPKNEWPNGIYMNSMYSKFYITYDGIIEQFAKNYKIKKKFRKSRFKNTDDVIKKINKYIKEIEKTINESKPPKGVNLSIVDKEIKRRGKANMLKHFKDIKKNKLYTKVNTPKSIDYLINYVSNFNESVNEVKGRPKFKIGQKVHYIPKLSGLSPKKKLQITRVNYKDGDGLTKAGYHYLFKDTGLMAHEKDIKLAESVNESVNEAKYTDQTGIKSSLIRNSEFFSLLNQKEKNWIRGNDVKIYKDRFGYTFTDGKREMVFNLKKPYSVIKPLGNARSEIKKLYQQNESVNEDISQKDLSKQLKSKFGGNYKIQGHNIYIKNPNSSTEVILSFIEKINKDNKLGYKRFFVKDKGSRKLIGSVPFGIAITIEESVVNEANGEFVVYVEKDNGRKKLLHTKKSQRAANMFMSKNVDKILNKSGIRSIGSMSKDQWEKKEAQFAENIKKSDMKTVTKKEWDRTHKDYKGMIKGQPYMMWFDKQTQSTVYGPVKIKESVNENKNVGHYERVGNQTIVDSNFINYSKGVLPNSELVHLGMGDFTLKTPKGDITFERSGKLVGIGQDFVGRHHRMTDNKGGKLIDELIKNMVKKKRAILSMSESLDEAKRSVVHKAAKKGSFPVSLVVVKNGKVIDQELVNTPEAVPAAFNVIQSKHKGAIVHIEDKTGKRLFSENLNEGEEPQIITQLRDVVKNGYQKLKDPKTGRKVMVDSFSASAMVKVYDGLKNPSVREKYVNTGIFGMQKLAFKFVK